MVKALPSPISKEIINPNLRLQEYQGKSGGNGIISLKMSGKIREFLPEIMVATLTNENKQGLNTSADIFLLF